MSEEKNTFPYKIGWQDIAKAVSQCLRNAYAQLGASNGGGTKQLVLGSGCPYPGVLVLPDGKRAAKQDGIAFILIAVPCGGAEDSEAFCNWMGGQAQALLAQAEAEKADLAAANDLAKKAWGEEAEDKGDGE